MFEKCYAFSSLTMHFLRKFRKTDSKSTSYFLVDALFSNENLQLRCRLSSTIKASNSNISNSLKSWNGRAVFLCWVYKKNSVQYPLEIIFLIFLWLFWVYGKKLICNTRREQLFSTFCEYTGYIEKKQCGIPAKKNFSSFPWIGLGYRIKNGDIIPKHTFY